MSQYVKEWIYTGTYAATMCTHGYAWRCTNEEKEWKEAQCADYCVVI